VKKLLPLASSPVGIRTEQRAKVGLGSPNGDRINRPLLDHGFELLVESINGKVESPWVFHFVWNNCIIAIFPIRTIKLLGPVDLDAVLEPVSVPDVAVDHKLCWVVPKYIKMRTE